MTDGERALLRDFIRAVSRADVMEAIAALTVPPGPPGERGKDAPPVDVAALKAEILAELPAPEKGEPGKDAVVDVAAIVAEVLAQMPAPKDGENGKDADPEALRVLVQEEVAKIPTPRDGKDAEPLDRDALIADVLARIPAPKDGRDADPAEVVGMVKAAVAKLPAPKDGKDGADGPELNDVVQSVLALIPTPRDGRDGVATRDELNELIKSQVAAVVDAVVEKRVADELAKRPQMEYRDIWRPETDYRMGNFVTFGGSVWHCNLTGTQQKPGDGGGDWTLAVKHARRN